MVIIINGSVGAGKSSTSWELQTKFDKSVMLDGDHIGAVHPFEIYDESRIEYLYETICLLVKFHMRHGYGHFVINYVFESGPALQRLVDMLNGIAGDIHCFWLTCSDEEQEKRISARSRDEKEWELKRFIELNEIQKKAGETGYIGTAVKTDGMNAKEVASYIWKQVFPFHN